MTDRRDELLQKRRILLVQYPEATLLGLQDTANAKLDETTLKRKAMGHHSHHDFDSMRQMMNALFDEIRENRRALQKNPAGKTDLELAELCANAEPSHFLHKRQRQYDSEPHMTEEHRHDVNLVMMMLHDMFKVRPLAHHFKPRTLESGASRG